MHARTSSKPEALEVVVKAQRHLVTVHLATDSDEWVVTMCRLAAERMLGRPMPRGTKVKGSLIFIEDTTYESPDERIVPHR